MDLNKIFIKDACPAKIGGQAVLEGVMMKNMEQIAISIRQPDGNLHVKRYVRKKKNRWTKIPLVRGVVALIDSLAVGMGTLMYSAQVLEDCGQTLEKDKMELWLEKKFGAKGAQNVFIYLSVALAVVFTVGIFIVFPTFAVNWAHRITENAILLNLFEGLLRISIFILYIYLISRMQDIRRVFQYHGAEHKTIHCFENGLELTVENCRQFPTIHPRCGTSFLMFVMVISLLLFSFLGWPSLLWRALSRILLIPVVAGLSYELLRWAGKSDSAIVKIISYPGLLLQKLTTKEPEADHLEAAISAMKAAMEYDPESSEEANTQVRIEEGKYRPSSYFSDSPAEKRCGAEDRCRKE